jgi:hypothetical protein
MSELNGAGLFMIIAGAFFAIVVVVVSEQLKSQKRVKRWDEPDEERWREPR